MKTLLAFLINIQILFAGPSVAYLDQYGSEDILKSYWNIKSEDWDLMLTIIEQEDDQFFGYHASSMDYRLFQDAVRVAVEKTQGIKLPEDFHYLRAPGSPTFEDPATIAEFFEKFDRKMTPLIRKSFITSHLLPGLAKKGIHLQSLPESANKALDNCLFCFAEMHDFYIDLVMFRNDMAKDPMVAAGFEAADLPRYFVPKTKEEFDTWLHNEIDALINIEGLATASVPAVDELALALAIPHKVLAEIMTHDKIWNDWYVNTVIENIYSDQGYETFEAVQNFLNPIDDTNEGQQERLLCLNVPLFGNHFRWDESTVGIFLTNNTIEGGDYGITRHLADFYETIGLPRELAYKVFQKGKEIVSPYANKRGVIFQFFDTSVTRYEFLDLTSYASRDFGYPYRNIIPSDLFTPSRYPRDRSIDVQLRLITGNATTLNPNSPIRMKRYDSLPPGTGEKILNAMRECLNGTKQPSKSP